MRPPMTLKHDLVPIVLSILTEKWAIQGQKEALWGLEKLDWSRESAILKYNQFWPSLNMWPVTQKMADTGNSIVMWRKPESHLPYNRYAFVWLLAYPKSPKEMRNPGGPQEREILGKVIKQTWHLQLGGLWNQQTTHQSANKTQSLLMRCCRTLGKAS